MAAPTKSQELGEAAGVPPVIPRLQAGDRLSGAEFERRYRAMPDVNKAELIEGVVYMPSPVSTGNHAAPHFDLIAWLGLYRAATLGVQGGDNGTLRLDLDNRPQPDVFLRILPDFGGQSRTSDDGYVELAPEWIGEIAASSVSYDLHDKLNAYRRNGVREYVVWRVLDREVDWFILREGRYDRMAPATASWYESEVFPGLWLDAAALVRGDLATVLKVAQQGIASPQHAVFVKQLGEKAATK